MLYNELEFYQDEAKMDTAIADSKELFAENLPYESERRLASTVVIFSDHFMQTAREALTTGCIAKMSDEEEDVFFGWVQYENGSGYRDITESEEGAFRSLSQWLIDELACLPHPVLNACFDAPTHTWSPCGTQ